MPADPRLCPLPHLDLNCGSGIQIVLMHAKATGSDLNDRICAVLIKVLMQPAFPCVIKRIQRPRSAGKALVRIIADGAI